MSKRPLTEVEIFSETAVKAALIRLINCNSGYLEAAKCPALTLVLA